MLQEFNGILIAQPLGDSLKKWRPLKPPLICLSGACRNPSALRPTVCSACIWMVWYYLFYQAGKKAKSVTTLIKYL